MKTAATILLIGLCGCSSVRKPSPVEVLTDRVRAVERRVKYLEFILAHGDPISDESWKVE